MTEGLYKDTPDNRNTLDHWKRKNLDEFEAKMTDKERPFPCIPATIGFSLNHLRYAFVGNPLEQSTIANFAALLKKYTEDSRKYGKYTSLIVFYHLPEEMKTTYTVEEYEQLFWEQLRALSAVDEKDWPDDIPTNPHDPIWEFCFHGERYFMYCATPAHGNRQSRHFFTMLLAITPRWVLQAFTKTSHMDKMKARVRERLSKYDKISIHPDLNSYGAEDNFEWRQYFLRDDHSRLSKCPYHRVLEWLKKDP
ncbi:YqcI/YcgG family protein [Salirhabdus sp. Marseille-P4669]|uniref:YqcI/YcgG family protein n=1 Tax=Salirhabdus sp. Marseille-P4669 TaxID=2042310 RepID=UPI000C7BBFA0|nr:YqcI/YcgG family protein [Salirhabdus sp. Marseille-P4669]